jgi:hypothetical protein
MRFLFRLMANLTDGKDGGTSDRIIHAVLALAPEA